MLRFKILNVAVGSILLVGTLPTAMVFGEEASVKPNVRSQASTVQARPIEDGAGIKYARSTVDRLNVRMDADLASKVIQMIGKSNRYEILEEQGDWTKIRLADEITGWVFHTYIDYEYTASAKAGEVLSEALQTAEVKNADLNQAGVVHIDDITNLRSGPGTDYEITGKAKPGETYPIVDTKGDWYVISLPDKSKAYVASWVVKTDFIIRNSNLDTSVKTGLAPKLFIYHTHNQESWNNVASNTKGTSVDDPKVNITLVGKRLGQQLQEKGIPVLAGESDITESLKRQGLNFSDSYSVSRQAVDKAIQTYPSLSYFFDIHRDANVPREKTTAIIGGKTYARVLFVIGTAHSGYKENKAFAEALDKLLNEKYPGLSRGILTKSEHQGNGEYNQSVSSGSLLMEVGGTNNTLQESLFTAEALADVFAEYYGSSK